MKNLVIAVDFDGTCVTHDYPKVGKDIGAVPVLRALVDAGHKIILYTMRAPSKNGGPNLEQDAIDWFTENQIPLYGVNKNKAQIFWTSSKKLFANIYIDDATLGAPLMMDESLSSRPFIDWVKARELLVRAGALEE